jgi:hypothetical protein
MRPEASYGAAGAKTKRVRMIARQRGALPRAACATIVTPAPLEGVFSAHRPVYPTRHVRLPFRNGVDVRRWIGIIQMESVGVGQR